MRNSLRQWENPPSHIAAANSNNSKKVHKLQKLMQSIDVESALSTLVWRVKSCEKDFNVARQEIVDVEK